MADESHHSPVNLHILCEDEELGRILETDLCAEDKVDEGITRIYGTLVCAEIVTGTPKDNPEWENQVRSATAAILALRHIDMISIESAKSIYARFEQAFPGKPIGVVIMRNEGESDFKMSCVYCGQKLWVQDDDVDKRGRCPNCKKAFTLPAQTRLLRLHMKVPDSTPVNIVYKNNPYTTRGAVGNLIGAMSGGIIEEMKSMDPENLKKSTVRVEIKDNEGIEITFDDEIT